MFGFHDGALIAVHGFIKKSQTTPKADLALARERLQEATK
jgi:phage-related protein